MLKHNKKTKGKSRGFTLVELIVVVVILAIIIGVAIAGIFKHVKDSRENTDINNASTLQKIWGTIPTEKEVYNELRKLPNNSVYTMFWTEEQQYDKDSNSYPKVTLAPEETYPSIMFKHLNELTQNGLPKSQTGNGFTLILRIQNGDATIEVKPGDHTDEANPGGDTPSGGDTPDDDGKKDIEIKDDPIIAEWVHDSDGDYKFIKGEDNITWTSNNKGIDSSTATTTWTITCTKDMKYPLPYEVSSEETYDKLTITFNGKNIVNNVSGVKTGKCNLALKKGNNTLQAQYSKDGSGSENEDIAYVVLNNMSIIPTYRPTLNDPLYYTGLPQDLLTEGDKSIVVGGEVNYGLSDSPSKTPTTWSTAVPTGTEVGEYHVWMKVIGDSEHKDLEAEFIGTSHILSEQAPGLYNSEGTTLIKPWDELKEEGTLHVTNGELNSDRNSSPDVLVGKLVISDEVTTIGTAAFYECKGLTSVDIPSSVITIGNNPFYNCTSLTSVEIPDSVTTIGERAFCRCSALKSVTIPSHITSIGERTFEYCKSLTSIDIPDSVTYIGNRAFSDCESLTSIDIPDSVTIIGYGAFSNCKGLTSITIPDRVTIIGAYAFRSCSSLTSVTILNGVTEIQSEAFSYCKSLTSITIPNSVTTIEDHAFDGCRGLISVTISDNITTIGEYTFRDCTSLNSVTIPDNVTTIGKNAFYNCTSLKSVTIPDSVTYIGTDAFKNVPHIDYHGTATGANWGANTMN